MRYIVEPKVIEAVIAAGLREKEMFEDPFCLPKFEYKTVTPDDDKEVYRLCARFRDQKVIQRDGVVFTTAKGRKG